MKTFNIIFVTSLQNFIHPTLHHTPPHHMYHTIHITPIPMPHHHTKPNHTTSQSPHHIILHHTPHQITSHNTTSHNTTVPTTPTPHYTTPHHTAHHIIPSRTPHHVLYTTHTSHHTTSHHTDAVRDLFPIASSSNNSLSRTAK